MSRKISAAFVKKILFEDMMNKTEFYKTSLNITNTDVHGYTKYLHEVIKA